MTFKNMRIVIVAALVAALLGGGVATARTLISGKDVRNSSLTGADIKNSSLTGSDIKSRSVSISDLTKATQNLIRSGGTSSTSGKNGTNGSNGANGANGAQGPAGPAGPAGAAGAKGDTGAGYDPSKVGAATSQVSGFTPWYDSSASTVVSFQDGFVQIDNGKNGIGGVNLPIARGTSLSQLASVNYTSLATGNKGAVLAIEVYTQGGLYQNLGDYTTLYYAPPTSGTTNAFATGNVWTSTRPSATGGKATGTYADLLSTITDKNKALILNASFRTTGSAATTGQTAPDQAAVSSVSIGLRNAEKPVTYSFVK